MLDRQVENHNALNERRADENNNIQAAIARTAARSIALYFSRPVRLFRPAKVNGWHTLKNLATQQGTTVTFQYLTSLVKTRGFWIIPQHFVPPMVVNAFLGTVLWGTYAEASRSLEPHLKNRILNAAISGGVAGACQAVVAAPVENVLILLNSGFKGHSWSCAWKEVFRETTTVARNPAPKKLQDIRQIRGWLQDVSQMAGRGWNGWGYTFCKDGCGFATFFTIFELSRCAGSKVKEISADKLPLQLLPAINGMVLVTGGVLAGLAYEAVCRPWDSARRVIYLERHQNPCQSRESPFKLVKRIAGRDGICVFFRSTDRTVTESQTKWHRLLRTAGRVGPWGIGFLVWEACGPGLS
ncbi:hypothetical protein BYT27DRAFT_7203583 [Phlegmacium glaucopus]|nr:hypothetical protein BYT27DRAFT_7203583 [Phlegmacium glaucopus]